MLERAGDIFWHMFQVSVVARWCAAAVPKASGSCFRRSRPSVRSLGRASVVGSYLGDWPGRDSAGSGVHDG